MWRIIHRTLVLAVAGSALRLSVIPVSAAASIREVRLWTAPDNSRLVFDLDQSVDYDLFRLHKPERIVVDIHHARLATKLDDLKLPDPVIRAIRYGSPKRGVLRVVIDVKERVQPRSFLLKPMQGKPYRLVIDLLRPDQGANDQPPITASTPRMPTGQSIQAGPSLPRWRWNCSRTNGAGPPRKTTKQSRKG